MVSKGDHRGDNRVFVGAVCASNPVFHLLDGRRKLNIRQVE